MNTLDEIRKQMRKHDAEVKARVIEECKEVIKEVYGKMIDDNDDLNLDIVNKFILEPNKDIMDRLERMK